MIAFVIVIYICHDSLDYFHMFMTHYGIDFCHMCMNDIHVRRIFMWIQTVIRIYILAHSNWCNIQLVFTLSYRISVVTTFCTCHEKTKKWPRRGYGAMGPMHLPTYNPCWGFRVLVTCPSCQSPTFACQFYYKKI